MSWLEDVESPQLKENFQEVVLRGHKMNGTL